MFVSRIVVDCPYLSVLVTEKRGEEGDVEMATSDDAHFSRFIKPSLVVPAFDAGVPAVVVERVSRFRRWL